MTGIILGVEPADGGLPNGVPHRPSPHQIWSLSRGVPIPRSKVTRCFWQVYNNAVQLTNWNTVKVIEDKHSSMQLNNEVFAHAFRVDRGHSGCETSQWGRRRNGVSRWPSPHQIWSLSRGVPIHFNNQTIAVPSAINQRGNITDLSSADLCT